MPPLHLYMNKRSTLYPLLAGFSIFLLAIFSCNNNKGPSGPAFAFSPEEMKEKTAAYINDFLSGKNISSETDSMAIEVKEPKVAEYIYDQNGVTTLWSQDKKWLPRGDALYDFVNNAKQYGLFPEDYHLAELTTIRDRFIADSLDEGDRHNALLWSKADVLFTDAFINVVKDIKLGRLPNDSITLRKDSVLDKEFYEKQFAALTKGEGLVKVIESLEPDERGYHELKKGLKDFLAHADYQNFTKVPSSSKDPKNYKPLLQKRLFEGGYLATDSVKADSVQLAEAVKKFQKEKGLAVDGVVGEATLRTLNTSDNEKFIRIAISMDKYKLLPEKMPEKYVWVNAAGNYMEVVEDEEVKLYSKVICGKAKTRTPVLNSAISQIITYPQWVPPPSIVGKEILPAVKRDPGYLAKKGFSLLDKDGEEVDPYSVDWSKYSKGIPYRVVQGSGDANALGIMKFHFANKYSVYLHDTNQRYLFSSPMRSLSHGCVRVQEWQKLAWYIMENDIGPSGNESRIDSVKSWLNRKAKKYVSIKKTLPVFIRYMTCSGQDGKIVFYDDPYNEDEKLSQQYFAGK